MVKFSGLDWSCGPRQCFWTLHYREWRSAWRARELGCNEGNGLAGGMLWSLSYITFTPVQHSATMCNLDMSNSSFKIHSVTSIRFGCCKMASYWLDAWMFKKSCILHHMMTNDKWWLFTKLEPHPKEIKRCETFKPAKTLKFVRMQESQPNSSDHKPRFKGSRQRHVPDYGCPPTCGGGA